MKYMVSSLDRPNNTSVYSIHSDLDSFILYNENEISGQVKGSEKELGPPEHSYSPSNEENDNKNLAALNNNSVKNME